MHGLSGAVAISNANLFDPLTIHRRFVFPEYKTMRAWQLDKVRRALHSFRALRAQNGNLCSWREVLDCIPASPGSPDLELEAFRRFAVGINAGFKPPEKLNDVLELLYSVELLAPDDLNEYAAEFSEAVAVHNRLANLSREAARENEWLGGSYRAISTIGDHEGMELRLSVEPPGTLLWAEEEYRSYTPPERNAHPADRADGPNRQHVIRRGFGLRMTDSHALNLFLRGADKTDLIHYVQFEPDSDGEDESLYFLRYAADQPKRGPVVVGGDSLRTSKPEGIVRFVRCADTSTLPPQATTVHKRVGTPNYAALSSLLTGGRV